MCGFIFIEAVHLFLYHIYTHIYIMFRRKILGFGADVFAAFIDSKDNRKCFAFKTSLN